MHPGPNPETYRQPFLHPPKSYLDQQSQMGLFPYLPAMLEKWLKPPGRLLEIGCEGGRGTIHLQEKGYDMVGIDTALDSLHYANDISMPPMWLNADALSLPFRSESFNGVILIRQIISLFHGRENRLGLLKNIYRVLKNKGFLFVSIRNGAQDINFWHVLHYFYCRAFVYPLPRLTWKKLNLLRAKASQILQVKKYLRDHPLDKKTRDLWYTTEVNNHLVDHIPFHIYRLNELKSDLLESGFKICDCRDYLETQNGAKIPAILRKGAPFLIFACQK